MTSVAPAVFLDFDGTITTRDVTDALLEAFAEPEWRAVEDAWSAGRIGSRECLRAQMDLVIAGAGEVDALLDAIEVDAGFVPLLELCRSRGIPVHVISDGFDYSIRRILGRPSLRLEPYLREMRIVASHLERRGSRWRASFPSPAQVCAHGCATCKPAAMASLRPAAGPSVFVGDGLSDRYAAAAADVVFAKSKLAAYCTDASIPYTRYDNLATVADRLEAFFESPTTVQGVFPGKAFEQHER